MEDERLFRAFQERPESCGREAPAGVFLDEALVARIENSHRELRRAGLVPPSEDELVEWLKGRR